MLNIKFKSANENQLEAITTTEGPLLIIAGPGTGKTFTLINRALNLIVNKKVDPSRILFATFTEKAAKELITRLSSALSDYNIDFNPDSMYLGTFHSICLNMLKDNIEYTNLKKNFSLKDQFDQQYFIYNNLQEFLSIKDFYEYINHSSYWDKCEDIIKILNRLEEELIDSDKLVNSNNSTYIFYGRLLAKYRELREKYNFLDFSTIQTETYKMLNKFPEVCKKIISNIDYVMIDEYQDTNHIQEKLTLLFGSKYNNICVVGDDDQAIYRFRGATVRNILEFSKHFPNCKQVSLTLNYRSSKDIVNFYNNWMTTTEGRDFNFDWDKYRYPKKIIPAKHDKNKSSTVIQCSADQENDIYYKILQMINELKNTGKINNYNQIAFLFKSVKNESVISLAYFLEKNGVPVYSPRSNMFFDREEIMLLIGILILLIPSMIASLGKGEIHKGISNYYLKCINLTKKKISNNDELLNWMKFRIDDHKKLEGNFKYAYSGLVYQLLEFEPFFSMLNVDVSQGVYDTRTIRNIGLFINLLVKFEYLYNIAVLTKNNIEKYSKRLFNQYIRFLKDGGINEYEDESEYAPSGCVSFLTIHQSKGLEFPIVFVGSQSSVPRKQYDENIEEIIDRFSSRKRFEELDMMKIYDFWRLYYVAFSRAQSLLVMLCDKSKSNEPSKYFECIYEDIPSETDFSNFMFEDVKHADLKQAYSFTGDIDTYSICPQQYKFFKELGFDRVRIGSTLFGTLVHQTIEDIHKTVLRNDTESITEDNIREWFNINYDTASRLNNSYLSESQRESALSQVYAYVDGVKDDWSFIINSELPISLTRKNYIINGKVDLVSSNNGKYEILDFKTEKKPIINVEIDKIERVRTQLEVYAYLIEKRYNIKIDSMKVYYTSEKDGNPYIVFRRDEEHIKKTLRKFDDIVEKIENKDFNRGCNDMKVCGSCDLRYYCKRR